MAFLSTMTLLNVGISTKKRCGGCSFSNKGSNIVKIWQFMNVLNYDKEANLDFCDLHHWWHFKLVSSLDALIDQLSIIIGWYTVIGWSSQKVKSDTGKWASLYLFYLLFCLIVLGFKSIHVSTLLFSDVSGHLSVRLLKCVSFFFYPRVSTYSCITRHRESSQRGCEVGFSCNWHYRSHCAASGQSCG